MMECSWDYQRCQGRGETRYFCTSRFQNRFLLHLCTRTARKFHGKKHDLFFVKSLRKEEPLNLKNKCQSLLDLHADELTKEFYNSLFSYHFLPKSFTSLLPPFRAFVLRIRPCAWSSWRRCTAVWCRWRCSTRADAFGRRGAPCRTSTSVQR